METLVNADFTGRVLHIWANKCFTITSNEMLYKVLGECSDISKIEWLQLLCHGKDCMERCAKGSLYCASHVHLDVLEELECPVCLDDFIATKQPLCGHKVCPECCKNMKKSGRTLCCPICRDPRFKAICG